MAYSDLPTFISDYVLGSLPLPSLMCSYIYIYIQKMHHHVLSPDSVLSPGTRFMGYNFFMDQVGVKF